LGNGLKLWIPVIAVAIFSITIVSISAEESLIPSWIKTIAGFWSDDQISDSEFLAALQFLVVNDILVIPEKETVSTTPPIVTQDTSSVDTGTNVYLESFFLQLTNYYTIVTILDKNGKSLAVNGDITLKLYDFDGELVYTLRKQLRAANDFEPYTNDISGKTIEGFTLLVRLTAIKDLDIHDSRSASESIATMKLTVTTPNQTFENEFPITHLPINEGYQGEDTGFITNFDVNKSLDIGPFFITIKDAGRYMGVGDDGKIQEFFRANLSTKNKQISDVNFFIDEMYITDGKGNLYSPEPSSFTDLVNVFLGESFEYEGGIGHIMFEKIPTDSKQLTMVMKITTVAVDLSETQFVDEIEFSLN